MTIALDTNILVHLLVSTADEHPKTRDWFEQYDGRLATTHTNIAEFLRLVTHPKVFRKPMSMHAAVGHCGRFIDDFEVSVLHESDLWWRALAELDLPLRANDIFDARIALCLRHHGVGTICSFDSGFARFSFLDLVTPG